MKQNVSLQEKLVELNGPYERNPRTFKDVCRLSVLKFFDVSGEGTVEMIISSSLD